MNATLEVIQRRRSLRNFSTQPLAAEEKEAILQAAFRSPTAGNMMLYSIIEVEDQALKDRLSETCDHQPFIAKSPFVLLFLADYQRWYDYFVLCEAERKADELGRPNRLPQEGDMLLACCDALIAAQTAVIAANRWASDPAISVISSKTTKFTAKCSTCPDMFCRFLCWFLADRHPEKCHPGIPRALRQNSFITATGTAASTRQSLNACTRI